MFKAILLLSMFGFLILIAKSARNYIRTAPSKQSATTHPSNFKKVNIATRFDDLASNNSPAKQDTIDYESFSK